MCPIAPSGPPSRDRCPTHYRSLVEPTSTGCSPASQTSRPCLRTQHRSCSPRNHACRSGRRGPVTPRNGGLCERIRASNRGSRKRRQAGGRPLGVVCFPGGPVASTGSARPTTSRCCTRVRSPTCAGGWRCSNRRATRPRLSKRRGRRSRPLERRRPLAPERGRTPDPVVWPRSPEEGDRGPAWAQHRRRRCPPARGRE